MDKDFASFYGLCEQHWHTVRGRPPNRTNQTREGPSIVRVLQNLLIWVPGMCPLDGQCCLYCRPWPWLDIIHVTEEAVHFHKKRDIH